jgi:two-component system sensor histidine kinase/response regulator
MLRRFAQGQRSAAHALEEALKEGHYLHAERIAHTLRSVAANIGAETLCVRAQALERALHPQAPQSALEPVYQALQQALMPLLEALEAWNVANPKNAANAVPVSPLSAASGVESTDVLRQLRRRLLDNDPTALECLQQNVNTLESVLGAAFTSVQTQIQEYEFEEALAAIDRAISAP